MLSSPEIYKCMLIIHSHPPHRTLSDISVSCTMYSVHCAKNGWMLFQRFFLTKSPWTNGSCGPNILSGIVNYDSLCRFKAFALYRLFPWHTVTLYSILVNWSIRIYNMSAPCIWCSFNIISRNRNHQPKSMCRYMAFLNLHFDWHHIQLHCIDCQNNAIVKWHLMARYPYHKVDKMQINCIQMRTIKNSWLKAQFQRSA